MEANLENWKEIIAIQRGNDAFVAENPTGGTVQMGTIDGRPGVSPMELILAGLAGCTGMDVLAILTKKHQPVTDFQIRVRGRRADNHPKVYTEIHLSYLVWGEGIDPKAVEHAIQLSEEKYCSVEAMLRASVPIYSQYQILKPGDKPVEEQTQEKFV